jgi:ribosomal protein S18 acetylase RimI-like enzyme
MAPSDLSPPAIFAALAQAYLALTEAVEPGDTNHGRDPDCVWASSSIPIAEINRVMAPRLAGTDAEVEARVEAIHERFAGLPYTWWLDPGAMPSDLAETLRWVAPATRRELVPAMALDLADLALLAAPAGVEIEVATTREAVVAAESLAAHGFGASAEEAGPFGSLFERMAVGQGARARAVVVHLDGRPSATALGCLDGQVLGIYNVATLPDARRRGLGLAATHAILRDGAARGARLAVLESTADGLPLYRRLGFREVGRFDVLTIAAGVGTRS